ncbi:hypothetical protein BASA61_008881 [Batrachochytrium salamandrivorans]|nr:hypothetical protein BASA61_008881 [Batrachochytrium salamandrivorans]
MPLTLLPATTATTHPPSLATMHDCLMLPYVMHAHFMLPSRIGGHPASPTLCMSTASLFSRLVPCILLSSSGPLVFSGLLLLFWSSSDLSLSATIPFGQQLPSADNIKHDPEPPNPHDIMASLEDIVASLTDRLRSLELKTKPFNKESPRSLREPKAALPDKFDGPADTFADL